MDKILLTPPVTFILFLLLAAGISALFGRLAPAGKRSKTKESSYACGEDMAENQGRPDYSEFFQFSFFFTIMHVIALVVATIPGGLSVTGAVYLGVTVLALFMLLRR